MSMTQRLQEAAMITQLTPPQMRILDELCETLTGTKVYEARRLPAIKALADRGLVTYEAHPQYDHKRPAARRGYTTYTVTLVLK
jgi:hypothetical protein